MYRRNTGGGGRQIRERVRAVNDVVEEVPLGGVEEHRELARLAANDGGELVEVVEEIDERGAAVGVQRAGGAVPVRFAHRFRVSLSL